MKVTTKDTKLNDTVLIEDTWNITIELSNGRKFRLSDENGALNVNTERRLAVYPRAANSVNIAQEKYPNE